jgi:hypothetical protein
VLGNLAVRPYLPDGPPDFHGSGASSVECEMILRRRLESQGYLPLFRLLSTNTKLNGPSAVRQGNDPNSVVDDVILDILPLIPRLPAIETRWAAWTVKIRDLE